MIWQTPRKPSIWNNHRAEWGEGAIGMMLSWS